MLCSQSAIRNGHGNSGSYEITIWCALFLPQHMFNSKADISKPVIPFHYLREAANKSKETKL